MVDHTKIEEFALDGRKMEPGDLFMVHDRPGVYAFTALVITGDGTAWVECYGGKVGRTQRSQRPRAAHSFDPSKIKRRLTPAEVKAYHAKMGIR